MSNICKRIVCRQRARQLKKSKGGCKNFAPKQYTSFNIFTRDGKNKVVTTERPMTESEAMVYFDALSISGNG